MGNQRTSGLQKRGGVWHIDKKFRGARICESTGTSDFQQAQEYFAKRMMDLREVKLFGARQERTFRTAATKFLEENQHKRSLDATRGRSRFWIPTSAHCRCVVCITIRFSPM
jgi:hypothetical protein